MNHRGHVAVVLLLSLSGRLVHGQYFPTAAQAPSTLGTGIVADLDGNGFADVLMDNGVHGPSPSLWRLPNVATGGLGQPLQLLFNGVHAYASGHFDSDPYADLVMASGGYVVVAHGLGNGMFGLPSNTGIAAFGGLYGDTSLIPTDLNGDGLDDVIVVTGYAAFGWSYSYSVTAALNSPGGSWPVSWTQALGYFIGTPTFALGDFNGDAAKDFCWFPAGGSQLQVVLGNGSGGFGPVTSLPLGSVAGYGFVLAAADLDGDGRDDLVVSLPSGLNVLYGSKTALFAPPAPIPGPYPNRVYVADVDRDGILDLVFWTEAPQANGRQTDVSMLRGTGNRTFASSFMPLWSIPANTTNVPAILVADFDGDGDPDLFGVPYLGSTMSYVENRAIFGRGCPGQGGIPQIAIGTATLGNGAFAISVTGAPSHAAVLGVSLGAVSPSPCSVILDLSPANLLLPSGALGFTMTNAAGFATLSLPLPGLPSLQGATGYAQWGIQDPLGGFSVGGATYSLSRGRTIVAW